MLKRGMATFLCVFIFFTGCTRTMNTDIEKSSLENHINIENTSLNHSTCALTDTSDYFNEEIPFSLTPYNPSVPQYIVHPDLGNVVNASKFKELSQEQINQLVNNGFVVLNPNPDNAHYYMKMYDIYEENEYKNIPNFITVDIALHLYHKFFDEALKGLEKKELYVALQELTDSMLKKASELYREELNDAIKNDLEDIIVYFSVANKLINDTYGDIPKELVSIAEKEIELIEASEGYLKSPLFDHDINYEEFIVRGHYTGDETLERYFKTMIWYGLIGYPLEDEKGEIDFDSIEKSLIITYLCFLDINNSNDIVLWDKIYAPTYFFVGQSDDINILNMKELIVKVYGEEVTLQDIKNKRYRDKLSQEISNLPAPQIKHKLITGAVDTPTNKQFRFMGQRYTLDANIMQELMFPIIRPVPSGLDVAGAFGSERAEVLAKKYYLKDLEENVYTDKLNVIKEKVESLEQDDWQNNLYNGWLWVLKSLWAKKDYSEGYPVFMKNGAWEDKTISSGLGSYAELKHDTVLYTKKPVAEMGGGGEVQEYCPHYVEPAVEVYDKLLWLVRYSKVNLDKRGLLTDQTSYALEGLEEVYELFRKCSVKELENTPITEEENEALKYIGGKLEGIENALTDEYQQTDSSAVISDVAGLADVGMHLEIGTGLPNDILVATYNNGKIYLARGAVYSYYEFLSDVPLTDEQWHEALGIEKVEQEGWQYKRINPKLMGKDVQYQPTWINSFKSMEDNNVNIPYIEYTLE